MFGRRLADGTETYAPLELVRLAFPRRVYTQSHMEFAAEVVTEVYARRDEIRGLHIVEQPAPAPLHRPLRAGVEPSSVPACVGLDRERGVPGPARPPPPPRSSE